MKNRLFVIGVDADHARLRLQGGLVGSKFAKKSDALKTAAHWSKELVMFRVFEVTLTEVK